MEQSELDVLFERLERMPDELRCRVAQLDDAGARRPGPNGAFAPVEHAWHLADLEREGYGARLERLLAEDDPALPDFDGDRIARERAYRTLALEPALAAFAAARAANLALLRAARPEQLERAGRQEGVGVIRLADVPRMMAEHDAGHLAELDGLAGTPGMTASWKDAAA
jgi:hypothetical protein